VALSDEQIRRSEHNQRWLEERSPDANRNVAAWLRGMASDLDDRRAAVAERMAGDFDALAARAERARRAGS
jgi:hypothetical protein